MKGQIKISEKPLNVVEIGNLPEKEFRIIIANIIQDLCLFGGKGWEDARNITKDLEKNERTNKQRWIIHKTYLYE